ncbi:MAG: hypothetical protein K2F74_06650 [Muribaculaceae bacterium]|nr:hypothetical protein [Muribaculaceae bacterium]
MKLKRSIVIPSLLLVYLGVMATLGYPEFNSGTTSPQEYFGIIAVTLIVIVFLHFNLRHREHALQRKSESSACVATVENTPPQSVFNKL